MPQIPAEIRVEIKSQVGTSHDPALVLVYFGDRLITTVTAHIEYEQGADGGYYPCVKLKKEDPESNTTSG